MIQFDRQACADLESAQTREWLEINGIGGYASSTITGLNTRRYHGILVAATTVPCGRTMLVSKVEETVVVDGRRYDLGANQYPGVIHPTGYLYLKQFRLDPFPIFTYEIEGWRSRSQSSWSRARIPPSCNTDRRRNADR
jgi:predicted glycogen debranching enzyme